MTDGLGLAGRVARAFIDSKLTQLVILGSLLVGLFAVVATPREEEPQIVVPFADVFVEMPGASAQEVEERISIPMEKKLREIPGVEYVYSISQPGASVAIVRFYVGQDEERSMVKLVDKLRANFDKEKAALYGVSTDQLVETLRAGLGGTVAGLAHLPREREDVPILVRLPREQRSSVEDLRMLKLRGTGGALVPLGELVRVEATRQPPFIYRKNLQRVVYVTGDVAGEEESPVYAILRINRELDRLTQPDGGPVPRYVASQPFLTERLSIKWDGEWQVTYEVFRDLGIAFAAVMVLIYILVVGWFRSFVTPLVIMAPIPLTLVGILPAHGLLGAFFTATSMIGFIAGAGIIVRNSIILVEFIELRRARGMPLDEAVVDAGAVRFRPMLLTAAAVVVGASVILFDPIFQGLALSLMAGEVASTLLSRMAVPLLYYMAER